MKSDKSVLVIDTPENCYKCPLHRHVNTSKRCMGNTWQYEDHSIVQSWCPLRPLPNKLELRKQEEWLGDVDRYEVGFNACIDEITGETE